MRPPRSRSHAESTGTKLALRDHRAARRRRKETEALLPMTWGWKFGEEQGERGFAKGKRCT